MDRINITLKKGQNLYFTSDLHFGHQNVIRFCQRPFEDVKAMGEALISNWNEVVQDNDIIINLGDTFWFNDRHSVKRVMSRLAGEKYFILGNHCTARQYELCADPKLHICSDITAFSISGEDGDPRFDKTYEVVCSHYPCTCYSHSWSAYMFFGHIHSRKDQPMMEFGEYIKFPHTRYFDVGTDRHDYTPVEFFDLLQEIRTYPYWELHK